MYRHGKGVNIDISQNELYIFNFVWTRKYWEECSQCQCWLTHTQHTLTGWHWFRFPWSRTTQYHIEVPFKYPSHFFFFRKHTPGGVSMPRFVFIICDLWKTATKRSVTLPNMDHYPKQLYRIHFFSLCAVIVAAKTKRLLELFYGY